MHEQPSRPAWHIGLRAHWLVLTGLALYAGRDDEMLKHQLGKLRDFAGDYDQCAIVCAHPAGVARTADGKLKVPDQFSVAQGRMWANKLDNMLVLHRPMYDEDPRDNSVAFHAKKIKKQPRNGFPTSANGVHRPQAGPLPAPPQSP